MALEEGLPLGRLLACTSTFGPLQNLTWDELENTDSRRGLTFPQMVNLAQEYGREWWHLMRAILRNQPLPGPIILHRQGKKPTLVSGNTRLMLARLLHVPVEALHLRLHE